MIKLSDIIYIPNQEGFNNLSTEVDTLSTEVDLTQGSLGSTIDSDGTWLGFEASNVELLDTALTFADALELLDDGYTSLRQEFAIFPETNISGPITWDGTPPAAPIALKYRATRTHNQVSLWIKGTYGIAGGSNTSVSFPLPVGLPTPSLWSSHSTGDVVVHGSGSILTSLPSGPAEVFISDPASVFTITISQSSAVLSVLGFSAHIVYFV